MGMKRPWWTRVVRPAPLWLVSVVTVGMSLGGCVPPLLQRPEPAVVHTYMLEWQGDGVASDGGVDGPDLLVSPVLAAPGFDGSEMAYVRRPHEIEYFAHHRWIDAPARMLEPLVVKAAEQSGLFRSVAEAGSGAEVALRLDSKLLHLQQVCRLNPSELQIALRVTLVEFASGRVVGERTLSVDEPLEARSPYAGVQAANRAVDRLMSELQAFLAERVTARRR